MVSDGDARERIRRLAASAGDQKLSTAAIGDQPEWQRNGGKLAYRVAGNSANVSEGSTNVVVAPAGAEFPTFSPDGSRIQGAGTILVVIGEQPYAEMKGDRTELNLAAEDITLVQKAKQSGARVVTVLLSGEGADEILGGYVRYCPLLLANGLLQSASILN